MLRPKIFAVVALTNGRGRVTWSCRVIIREECAYEQRSKLTAAELLRVQQRGARGTHVQPKDRREGADCRYRFSSRQWHTGAGRQRVIIHLNARQSGISRNGRSGRQLRRKWRSARKRAVAGIRDRYRGIRGDLDADAAYAGPDRAARIARRKRRL